MNIYAAIMWVAIIGCIWHAARAQASETAKQGRREETAQARREIEFYQKSKHVQAWGFGAPGPNKFITIEEQTFSAPGICAPYYTTVGHIMGDGVLCLKPSSPATEPNTTKPQQPHQQPYTGKETKPQ